MPRRKAATTATEGQKRPTRRSTRRNAPQDDTIPDIYNDMLVDAYHNNPNDFEPSSRATKRRKVNHAPQPNVESLEKAPTPRRPSSSPAPPSESSLSLRSTVVFPQQIILSDDYVGSDESDDFEDVDIDRHASTEPEDGGPVEPKSLHLDLSAQTRTLRKVVERRKPVTKAERDFRLDVHKWHFLCLLVHVATLNKWCDNNIVQKRLKSLVPRKTINNLHLDESRTQAERKYAFDRAIEEVCVTWRLTWTTTARGLRRSFWRDNLDISREVEEAEDPIDLEDFCDAAKECSGSRDTGTQLFCALLRSVAVDTRLVCSLQVLPFTRIAKGESPQKPVPAYIQAGNQEYGTGQTKSISAKRKKKIADSPYPVWWVEVFSPAVNEWIPLDPLVRNTINKPRTGFEPPASDNLNSMSYVIAFEEGGTAKDVTRRYTASYNAKTRKSRIESTKHGATWYGKVMHVFGKPVPEPRDVIENAALDRRLAMEGMPKSVQDFRNHPIYVLERHLRQNEVIEPRRECGKLTVGTGKNQKVESVFRAKDVHACRSADGWYRRGRDVKPGEQPLKRVASRRHRSVSAALEDDDNEVEHNGVALYAEFQTDVYIPPAVVDGKVPRNGFGNLDVYVPSMIPAGAIHVRHPLAAKAAKVLKIDAAEAVTGFKFKGRQGTAIVDGVVIDARYAAAMLVTVTSLEDELEQEVNSQRSAIALNVWKKMHAALRVRQKVHEEYGQTTKGAAIEDYAHDDDDNDDDPSYQGDLDIDDEADGGGFIADVVGEATKESKAEEAANLSLLREKAPIKLPPLVIRQQVVVVRSPHKAEAVTQGAHNGGAIKQRHDDQELDENDLFGSDPDESGGFLLDAGASASKVVEGESSQEGGGFVLDDDQGGGDDLNDDEHAGGFVPENDDDAGGGFIPDDDTDKDGGGFPPTQNELDHSREHEARPNLAIPTVVRPDLAQQRSVERSTSPHLAPGDSPPNQATRPRLISAQHSDGPPLNSSHTTRSQNATSRNSKGKMTAVESDADSETSDSSQEPDEGDVEDTWYDDAFGDDM